MKSRGVKSEATLSLHLVQEVDVLREKIKDSEVKVEIESKNSDLAEMLNKVRKQYDKLAAKNLKETEEWYQSKVCLTRRIVRLGLGVSLPLAFITQSLFFLLQFENIKVVEAQNNEVLASGKTELKELLKKKQSLEIKIQSVQSMVNTHTHTLSACSNDSITLEF